MSNRRSSRHRECRPDRRAEEKELVEEGWAARYHDCQRAWKKPAAPPSTPAGEKLEEAVQAQADLLAEFERLADELNKVLANLEGSTLVKRLKAALRHQSVIAGKIGDQVGETFGRSRPAVAKGDLFEDLTQREAKNSDDVSRIMDDMQAYFERRQFQRFKLVLDEMRKQDPVGGLRQLGDDLKVQTGLPIAECEFWSDTFDRWADNLVDVCKRGKCPGCKSEGNVAAIAGAGSDADLGRGDESARGNSQCRTGSPGLQALKSTTSRQRNWKLLRRGWPNAFPSSRPTSASCRTASKILPKRFTCSERSKW